MTRTLAPTASRFVPFEQEVWQSRWERSVEMNIADSAVRHLSVHELLDEDGIERLMRLELTYPEVNGTSELRTLFAELHPGATPANVLVTAGAAEANCLVCQALLRPGDEVVVFEPGYRQVRGVAEALGAHVRVAALDPSGWRLDLDELKRLITPATRLVYVVNPNNPTGTVLSEEERTAIVRLIDSSGAWLLADEVYRGSEREGDEETPTFWSAHERVIVVNSLSKVYGLCGLRIGCAVAQEPVVDELWRRHEYLAISAAGPSMMLAEAALTQPMRTRLLDRQRAILGRGWEVVSAWISEQAGLVSVVAPAATAVSLLRVHVPLSSMEVADRIRTEESVLVIPGDLMGAPGHLRVTHGFEPNYLRSALDRIGSVLPRLA
jgi:aspartate/methionine/tyrosine aminotransferase